jgi:GNAT superfamily N-acetyltransferase
VARHEALLGNTADDVTDHEVIEAAALGSSVRAIGGRAELVGGAVCAQHPLLPIPEVNRALPVEPRVDLDAVHVWYGGRAHVVVAPPDHPELIEALPRLGYAPARAWMAFQLGDGATESAATDLRVEETNDADAFALTLVEGYGIPTEAQELFAPLVGLPGWHCFLAWSGRDEPAGCGALYLEGRLAWLGMAATRPSHRRQGAQIAVLLARIEAARALGADALYTETGAAAADGPGPSYRNILRAGFRESYLRANWQTA